MDNFAAENNKQQKLICPDNRMDHLKSRSRFNLVTVAIIASGSSRALAKAICSFSLKLQFKSMQSGPTDHSKQA